MGLAWSCTALGGRVSILGPHCLEEKGLHTRFLPEAGSKLDLPLLPGPPLRGSSHLTESSMEAPREKNQFSWFHFNPSVPFLINFPVPRVTIALQSPAGTSCQVRTAQLAGAAPGPQLLPDMFSPRVHQTTPKPRACLSGATRSL